MLTYPHAKEDVRALYSRVAPAADVLTYGLHGLRVEAYNRARAHDPLLAVAQGGWASSAHKRYARFNVSDVLALPSAMIAGAAPSAPAAVALPIFDFLEPAAEVVVPRSSGPRLGRARRKDPVLLPSSPPLASSPGPRTRTRPGVSLSAISSPAVVLVLAGSYLES